MLHNALSINSHIVKNMRRLLKMLLVILSIYATVAQNFGFAGNPYMGVHFTPAFSAYNYLIFK